MGLQFETTVKSKIRKLGSSFGVVIPTPLLADLGIAEGDPVDLAVRGGKIIVTGLPKKPRNGWAADSRRLAAMGEDALVWLEFSNAGDRDLKW